VSNLVELKEKFEAACHSTLSYPALKSEATIPISRPHVPTNKIQELQQVWHINHTLPTIL